MKTRWYLSTLIFILTLLGVANQQRLDLPNQEIVLQFTHDEVSSIDTQNAIEIVKKQLQTIGVNNIQVLEQKDGQLKITYYSDTDAASVKKILSEEKEVTFEYALHDQDEEQNKLPSDKSLITYNLDVFEIQNGNDSTSNLGGKLALQLKTDSDRFFNPNVFISIDLIDVKENDQIAKVTYKLQRTIAIAIDNTSHKIPEVRAGPTT